MTAPDVLFERQAFPVFQNKTYPDRAAALACATGDIRLMQDPRTGLIHNAVFDPARMVYDADYENEQAVGQAFPRHLHEVADFIDTHMAGLPLIEVGCGKAAFLSLLRARGRDVRGLDPSYAGDDPDIEKRAFEPGRSLGGRAIVLRHVLEHIPDPVEFLLDLRDGGAGRLIYIEVPCLDWISRNNAWFDIFYEHVNYFRLDDFRRMFADIVDVRRFFGGQYLGLVADLSSLRRPRADATARFRFGAAFDAAFQTLAARFRRQDLGGRYYVWGGSSKGVIFSLLMARAGLLPAGAIDINPVKQGRFMPASGVAIMAPEQVEALRADGTPVVVMNPNYLAEIREMTGHRLQYIEVH